MGARMELKTVKTEHVPVQYLEGGSGHPLVYLHGAGGMTREDPLLARLAESFHVHAPYLPGYGESEECPELRDMLDFTLHTWDVVAALGLGALIAAPCMELGIDDGGQGREQGLCNLRGQIPIGPGHPVERD